MSTQREGIDGEGAVARYLIRRGWTIEARRWRGGGGEIDLIARRGRTIAFVEVKTRARRDYGDEPVSFGQRRRLHRAAETYLVRHPPPRAIRVRCDLALVGPARPWRRIEYLIGDLDEEPPAQRQSRRPAERNDIR
jgi:putative endonuclease